MNALLDFFFGKLPLDRDFTATASRFYMDPSSMWEPVTLRDERIYYLLKNDPFRNLVSERMMFLSRQCVRLWNGLLQDTSPKRARERDILKNLLDPRSKTSFIVQKPPYGVYDVRAYAEGSWIFLEIPTFPSIESSSEESIRDALFGILLHEIAHVAGYWEHGADHDACMRWLRSLY